MSIYGLVVSDHEDDNDNDESEASWISESTEQVHQDCISIVSGQKVHELDILKRSSSRILYLHSLVRGVRFHLDFTNSPEAIAIGNNPKYSSVLRARNACQIMNHIMPHMDNEVAYPYCIWYPTCASEETYRKLAQSYPSLIYIKLVVPAQ
jgi:hypothetical protein